ncbi:MAG TPA: hypothetical protein VLA05_02520, partial [Coriobacteriia bacterium]|nr:hypothetical protein [Coriobacteriia bacterium]
MTPKRTRGMLAARIVRLTLAVGAVTIGAALVVASISVSRLSAEAARNRDLRAIQSVEDGVESHLRSISALIEQAAGRSQKQSVLEERLTASFIEAKGSILQIVVADRAGRLLVRVPANADVDRVRQLPAFLSALAGRAGFLTIPADDGEPMQLWMTRTAFNRKGEPILVLVRLDTGFLSRYLSA